MVERQVPDGERLELGVARAHTATVLLVELGEAGGHLARPRAGCRDDHDGALGLDVLVLAVALVADDAVDVVRVALDGIVQVAADAERVEALAERVGSRLVAVLRDAHAAYEEAEPLEHVHEAQQVVVVGDSQIAAHLGMLDVVRVDDEDDFDLVDEALQHAQLRVGFEAGKNARCMVVVEQLAAELQVELAAELVHAIADA